VVNDLNNHCDLAGVKARLREKHNTSDLHGAPSGKMLEFCPSWSFGGLLSCTYLEAVISASPIVLVLLSELCGRGYDCRGVELEDTHPESHFRSSAHNG
jgi:hypothetical protein